MQGEEEVGEDEWPDDEEEDAPGAAIVDPIERMWEAAPEDEEEDATGDMEVETATEDKPAEAPEENIPAERPQQHGRFISSLLSGGLLGGLVGKRKLPGAAGGSAKRPAV